MKRIYSLGVLILAFFVSALVFSQSTSAYQPSPTPTLVPSLQISKEIGRAVPRSIIYDPNFERLAVIDARGRLSLVDALTYQTQHVLHEDGNYNDLAFSHDGRWLALAIGQRMELWDAQTGTLKAQLDNSQISISVLGPLTFSRDDKLLLFNTLQNAPQSIRRSENDTTITPWLWNLTAARNEGESTFPKKVEAYQFFDYRNGFVLGPDNRIVAALPGRLHIIDAYSLEIKFEIDTARYEQDPLYVGFSLRDNKIYVQPVNKDSLLQVDTQKGVLVEVPLDKILTPNDLQQIGGLELSSQARVIGQPKSKAPTDLSTILFGDSDDFRKQLNFHPLTITLVDLLTPPDNSQDQLGALLFVYDETDQVGIFLFSSPSNVSQMVLNPDNEHLILRRDTDQGEQLEVYLLSTGTRVTSLIPALRDVYSYQQKNRVLAYDQTGKIIISDFQRFEAASGKVLAEDLHYSNSIDRFFFTSDSQKVVTLSGSEWRLWDIQSGTVLQRKALQFNGSILDTSADGFQYLTVFTLDSGQQGVEIYDVATDQRRSVKFANLLGRDITDIIPSPDWEHFFVIYSVNRWGQYTPGNEVAIYGITEGQMWFLAGDDLPPPDSRTYGWVNNDTVYVYGQGYSNGQPQRVYGASFAPDGTPDCLVQHYPDKKDEIGQAWYHATLDLRGDEVARLAKLVCDQLSTNPNQPIPTLSADTIRATPTAVLIAGIPACLTERYPDQAQAYAETWRQMTEGLSADQIKETEKLLCEGIGTPQPNSADAGSYQQLTMMIDIQKGIRASGSYTAPVDARPLQPILDEYYRTTNQYLNNVVLSPDQQLLAASSMPGELIIYRLVMPYHTLLANNTATFEAQYQKENRIGALPTYTPTFSVIGTEQPTLTPTVTPTPPPRPIQPVNQSQSGADKDFCPTETLYNISAPPPAYSPNGQLVAPVQGDSLWVIQPETGQRVPNDTIPKCNAGIQCTFSPDHQWILAETINEIYVERPDGSDERLLFDKSKPDVTVPSDIAWSGSNTLEYTVYGEIPGQKGRYDYLIQRDILGVFPDPAPWWPVFNIREVRADLISRQPGGPWAVARTTFSTGVNPGYAYYLYNTETKQSTYFARLTEFPEQDLTVVWHPLGDRLFYAYPTPPNQRTVWYQYTIATGENLRLGDLYGGVWSNDGRYIAFATDRRTQPVGVWDSQTGLVRTYCIPETGARLYEGAFTWSPDSRYLALQAKLPKDESKEGAGQHTLIVDTETGTVTDLTSGVGDLVMWMSDPGSYGKGE